MDFKSIEKKIKTKEKLSKEEVEFFLDTICENAINIINHPTLENTCDAFQGLIGDYLQSLGLKIYPCITNKVISENVIGHSFLVVSFKEYGQDDYIVDPSFLQFLCLNDNYKDLYIHGLRVKSFSPFYYANNINKKLLLEFLKKNYMVLNENSAYLYGNAFMQTKVSIKEGTNIPYFDGIYFIDRFHLGSEKLRDYGYPKLSEAFSTEKIKK